MPARIYIKNLIVAEGARRRGLASRLMHAAERAAEGSEHAIEWAYLEVDTDNAGAQALYAKLGYEAAPAAHFAGGARRRAWWIGLAHALKHHRAVSRMDFLLRSAHEERLRNAHGAAEGAPYPDAEPKLYTQTAREVASDPSFLMHEAAKLAMAKERRRAASSAPQSRRRTRRPLRRR